MWPQLLELIPHIARLLPHADRFFSNKSATEDANRKALETIADNLRSDLGQVTASHAGLYRQLNDQSEKLALIAADTQTLVANSQYLEGRIVFVEQRLALNSKILFGTFVLNVLMLLTIIVLLRHR